MPPTVIAILQARMSSNRLPGKVLQEIAGQPMLLHAVARARRAATVDQVIVATTIDSSDDPLEDLCRRQGIPCFRGSLNDVLDRYYQAAAAYEAGVIVRLTADCPLIDPELIDDAVNAFLGKSQPPGSRASHPTGAPPADPAFPYDFVANRLPPPWGRTYPIGLDVEVCSFAALQQAWRDAREPYQREHVMPYLYEDAIAYPDRPARFRILLLNHELDYGRLRWTVDTAADLELVRRIFASFPHQEHFSWRQVLDLFAHDPSLAEINAQVQHKSYRDVDPRHV